MFNDGCGLQCIVMLWLWCTTIVKFYSLVIDLVYSEFLLCGFGVRTIVKFQY